jgi:hypothetical protein
MKRCPPSFGRALFLYKKTTPVSESAGSSLEKGETLQVLKRMRGTARAVKK